MIATGYKLPFKFTCPDVPTMFGRPVSIRVRTVAADDAGRVCAVMRVFERAAVAGAFGDESIAPWNTGISVAAEQENDRREFLFSASACRISDEAWVVLCHMLLRVHRSVPISSVDLLVVGASSKAMVESSVSTYPRAYAPLPFELDDLQPEGGGYSFFVTTVSPVTPENEATLNAWLKAWTEAVLHGGYGLSPIDPASDYVEPFGDGVDAYDNTIEWAVFKLRADPVAAIDALLNVFACFHARCQPIRSVEIG